MINCSYIIAKQRDGEMVKLFEGNYPLPFFWLMLLDKRDIIRYNQQLSSIGNQKKSEFNTTLVVDKLKAISLAADRRDYLKKYYKQCILLYDDWIYYMQTADFSNMKIYINIYPASLTYPSIENFTTSLLKAISCFDEQKEAWYEETIAGTCGYESHHNNKKRFVEVSGAYQNLNRQNIYGGFEKKLHLKKRLPYKKKIKLLIFSIVCVIILALLLLMNQ